MEHHFNVYIAVKYGIAEAVILNNLWYWVKKNEANDTNLFDGEYWTYNSIKAFEKLFPYLTNKQIRTTLKHLVEAGIIKTGNYNKSEYDHTTWYSFTEKGFDLMESSNCPTGQIELPTGENRIAPQGKPIPNNKHNNKNTDEKTHIQAEFENLWAIYPKKQGKAKAFEYYRKARKGGVTFDEVRIGIEAYADYIKATQTEDRYIKHGSTFFSQQAWQDEWRIPNEKQMGRFYDRTTEQDSRGMAGATVGSGSGVRTGKVTFPRANFGLQEEDECEDRS